MHNACETLKKYAELNKDFIRIPPGSTRAFQNKLHSPFPDVQLQLRKEITVRSGRRHTENKSGKTRKIKVGKPEKLA